VDHFGAYIIGKLTQLGHIKPAHVSGHLYPIEDRCRQLKSIFLPYTSRATLSMRSGGGRGQFPLMGCFCNGLWRRLPATSTGSGGAMRPIASQINAVGKMNPG
jgi:hypothetical protein